MKHHLTIQQETEIVQGFMELLQHVPRQVIDRAVHHPRRFPERLLAQAFSTLQQRGYQLPGVPIMGAE